MSLYKKNGVTAEGIPYTQIEETTIYEIREEHQLRALIARINKETGIFVLDYEKERLDSYPGTYIVDRLEIFRKN